MWVLVLLFLLVWEPERDLEYWYRKIYRKIRWKSRTISELYKYNHELVDRVLVLLLCDGKIRKREWEGKILYVGD